MYFPKGYCSLNGWFLGLVALGFSAVQVGAQGFGSGANMSVIPEGILKYSIYARDTVLIGYNARTASGGSIGTRGTPALVGEQIIFQRGEVIYSQQARIRGNLIARGAVVPVGPGIQDVEFHGFVTTDSSATFVNGTTVQGRVYARSGFRANGAGGPNRFAGGLSTGGSVSLGWNNNFQQVIQLSGDSLRYDNGHFSNIFSGQTISLGDGNNWLVWPSASPGVQWRTSFSQPDSTRTETFVFPETVVDSSGTRNCNMVGTQIRSSGTESWSQALCNMGAISPQLTPGGLQVLPPGIYGNFSLGHNDTLVLGEGIYHFNSLNVSSGTRQHILTYQPTGGRTQILAKQFQLTAFQPTIRPFDTTGLAGGTILLYTDSPDLVIGQESTVWATIMAPRGHVRIVYGSRLFGQIFARKVTLDQNFDGNEGRYIPFYPERPRISIVGVNGTAVQEGNSESTAVPIVFTLEHLNGLPVTIFFHTRPRAAGGAAPATPGVDYRLARDSVRIAVGSLQGPYTLLVNGDTDFEPDEFFEVYIDSVRNGRLDTNSIWDSLAVITIRNDDAPPVLGFGQDTLRVNEGDSLWIRWISNKVSTLPALVSVVRQGTVSDAEHNFRASQVQISAGQVRDSLFLHALSDGLDEPDETLILRLRNPLNATLGPDSVLVVVVADRDPPVGLSAQMIFNYVVLEDTGIVRLFIELERASGWPIRYSLIPLGLSSVQSDDYLLANHHQRVIPAGATRDSVNLLIHNDIFNEAAETLVLWIGDLQHLQALGRDSIRVTILANDPPVARDTTVELLDNAPLGYAFAQLIKYGPNPPSYTWHLLETVHSPYFILDANNGILSVANNSILDARVLPELGLSVELRGPVHRDTAVVRIQLVNTMRPPVIINGNDTVRIRENSPAGALLDSMRVAPGSGLGIIWSIIGGSGGDLFTINPLSGNITVNTGAVLDYEARVHYTLQIMVVNASGGADTLLIPVALIDVVEHTQVQILRASTQDTNFVRPSTIWINRDTLQVQWQWDLVDTTDIATLVPGRNLVIRSYRNPAKDQWGTDTLVVWMNTTSPVITWNPPPPIPPLPRWSVAEVREPGDTLRYVNNSGTQFCGIVQHRNSSYVDTTTNFCTSQALVEGFNWVRYIFRDAYGNVAVDSIPVMLDTQGPVVRIHSPQNHEVFKVYTIDVDWSVDGQTMDTLTRQGLQLGLNTIVRMFVDLAGNVGRDSVRVLLEDVQTDMQLELVKPLIDFNDPRMREELARLRTEQPLRPGERYTLSVQQSRENVLDQLVFGDSRGQNPSDRIRSGEMVFSGPTIRIEARFPHVGGLNGAGENRGGTLGDLLEGMRTSGFQAPGGMTLEQFVTGNEGQLPLGNPDTIPIWKNDLQLNIQIYDNLGQFVDNFRIIVEDLRQQYLNDEGIATFFLTLEADAEKGISDSQGRFLGNGAYLIKGIARTNSTLLFNTPNQHKGESQRTTDNLLKTFGYRRPQ